MPNNEEQEVTYPIYNQYIYKDGIGWVLIGGGSGGETVVQDSVSVSVSNHTLFITSDVSSGDEVDY